MAFANLTWTIGFIPCLFLSLANTELTGEARLLDVIFKEYKREARPCRNASKPVQVAVGFILTRLDELELRDQILSTTGWLSITWKDEFLTWNPHLYDNLTKVNVMANAIWLPEIALDNSVENIFDDKFTDRFRVSIHYSGEVLWEPGGTFHTACEMSINAYPFDHQTCNIVFANWQYTKDQVNLTSSQSKINMETFAENGEWEIEYTKLVRAEWSSENRPSDVYPEIVVTIHVRRRVLYYLVHIMMPCMMMSLLVLVVFHLPPDSGEKVSLGVTVLLAFSVFQLMIAESVPTSSKSIPLIGAVMEPGKIRCLDAFEKSYTPNGQNTKVAALDSSGTTGYKYQRFRSSLQEYGNSASFHGLRFVTDPLANKPRRLIWLCLLMACLAFLVHQIVDRVTHFYSYPVTVNVKVNYNTTLQFPAVTICNQNAFKATSSASLGRYRLIEKMYTEPETFNQDRIREFSAENTSLADLYLESAHRKEDFIFRSVWKGVPVPDSDIHELVTDHGVCYTFKNTGLDGFVTSPGVENGLRLTLNIEQYEYMPGPHDAAGIKMLLHDRDEIPRVHALGQAIPPGSHVFVGVKIVEVTNLPLPHGSCLDKTLDYSDIYTTEACQLDCLTKRAGQICGCRSLFMPHKNGYPPICTLDAFYGCLQNVLESFPAESAGLCDCPVPCHFRLYETDISYASTSAYTLNKLLGDEDKKNLTDKLLKASEVTNRYELNKFSKIQKLNDRLKSNMNKLRESVIVNLKEAVGSAILAVNERFEEIEEDYNWKEYLYRYQAYIMEKNFMRPRDAYEERTFHIVALGYAEYIMKIESRIRRLASGNMADASRRVLFDDTSDLLSSRRKIVETALVNFTTLIEAYDTGIQIFNYKFFSTPRSHNIPAAPKLLIKESRVHNSYAVKYGERFGTYLNRTIKVLDFCQSVVDKAFYNETLDEGNVTECRESFRYLMRNWVFARSVFYFDTIDWPLKQLEERLKNFDMLWNELRSVYENLDLSLTSLKSEIELFEKSTFVEMRDIQDAIEGYLNNTVTKANVSDIFTSKNFRHLTTSFDQFFQHVRSKESSVSDWIQQLGNDAFEILKVIVNDEDSWEYYNFTGKTHYLSNISDIEQNLGENYTLAAELMHFSDYINGTDSDIFSTYDDMVQEMTEYKESLKIDSSFVKNNFLNVDIFYRQMSYEEIHQQKAYEMFSLWCDIGGTMGLFLGASFLSVVEIVDFVLTHLTFKKKPDQDQVKRIYL